MEEKDMIPIKEEKGKKVEIIKDLNSITDSEKESQSQKEIRKKERIFLIQLIVVFLVWMFLLYLVMDKDKKPNKNIKKYKAPKHKTQHVKPKNKKLNY